MSQNTNEVKLQISNLCNALLRNINDNFESVSFDIYENGDIQVKVILEKVTESEEAYIDDMIAEFSSLQQSNRVNEVRIEVGKDKTPLKYLVYLRE